MSIRTGVAVWLAALLVACAGTGHVVAPTAPSRETSPEKRYERLAGRGEPVFEVDAERSLVIVTVRRAGALANLGHDHVVASHRVRGFAAPRQGIADLSVRAEEFVIDEPDLRRDAGLDRQPTPTDIEGTRTNMLKHVLNANAHPLVLVHVEGVPGATGDAVLPASVTVNGVTRQVPIPARIDWSGEGMRVTGRVGLMQSAFGIVPFSLLGGAIRVDDGIELRFDVVGRRVAP